MIYLLYGITAAACVYVMWVCVYLLLDVLALVLMLAP